MYIWARSNHRTEIRAERIDETRLGMNKAGHISLESTNFPPTNEWSDTNFRGVFLHLRKASCWHVKIIAYWQWTQFWPWRALHFGCVGLTQHDMGIVLLSRAMNNYGLHHMGEPWSNHIWLRSSGLHNVDLYIKKCLILGNWAAEYSRSLKMVLQ